MPVILDIEASGFGLGSYPIEVGVVMADGRSWCSLVRPEPSWQHWDPNAATVHKITREQLLDHGRKACEIAQLLNERLRGLVVYSDAWAHDYTWLNKLYEAADMHPSYRLENLRALLSDDEASRWHDLKLSIAGKLPWARHRASNDARLLQMTLQALRAPQQAAA
jgi:DNA polymerase III epsilon subunit-like protein